MMPAKLNALSIDELSHLLNRTDNPRDRGAINAALKQKHIERNVQERGVLRAACRAALDELRHTGNKTIAMKILEEALAKAERRTI